MGSIMTVRLHKHSKGENILGIINGYLVTIYPDWTDCLQLQYPITVWVQYCTRPQEIGSLRPTITNWTIGIETCHYSVIIILPRKTWPHLDTISSHTISECTSHFSSICNSNNPPSSNNMTIQFSDATDNSSAHIHIASLLLPPNFENASPQQYVEPSINHILRSLKGGEPILPHNRRERRCTV